MNGLIGMWLMFSAVIFGCICLFGMDFTFKQKIWAMVHFEMFITALLAGAYFLSKRWGNRILAFSGKAGERKRGWRQEFLSEMERLGPGLRLK